ncbi:MAG: hypothetical protein K9N23_22205 [Akkermansiaceae bacterium]|nr:hypothetical protein [Akkermansiaceae bacterium]MCF8176841.1 hypothetical protein [Burkholderiaceae bacterium]
MVYFLALASTSLISGLPRNRGDPQVFRQDRQHLVEAAAVDGFLGGFQDSAQFLVNLVVRLLRATGVTTTASANRVFSSGCGFMVV